MYGEKTQFLRNTMYIKWWFPEDKTKGSVSTNKRITQDQQTTTQSKPGKQDNNKKRSQGHLELVLDALHIYNSPKYVCRINTFLG